MARQGLLLTIKNFMVSLASFLSTTAVLRIISPPQDPGFYTLSPGNGNSGGDSGNEITNTTNTIDAGNSRNVCHSNNSIIRNCVFARLRRGVLAWLRKERHP